MSAPAPCAQGAAMTALHDDVLARTEALCGTGSFILEGPDDVVVPSAGLCSLLGLPWPAAPQPLGSTTWLHPRERPLLARLWAHAEPGVPFEFCHGLVRADGDVLPVLQHAVLHEAAGPLRRGTAVLRDLRAQQAAQHRLQLAEHAHPTTGLPNRRWLLQELDVEVDAAAWRGHGFALVSIEVPRIAELAGSMGFAAADALARSLAQRLRDACTARERAAQVDGAEFAVVLAHDAAAGREPLARRAQALREVLEAAVPLGAVEVCPSVRIGIARFPADGASSAQVLQAAQRARGEAAARLGCAFHDAQAAVRHVQALSLEADLRRALAQGELTLCFEPQAALHSGDISGMAASPRWQPPGHAEWPREVFLPVAERSGLMGPLGDWMIRQACAQAARWPWGGPATEWRLSLPLSPVQFQVGDVVATLSEALRDSGLKPAQLRLAVTEAALLHDEPRVLATLQRLRQMGIEVALAGFGAGLSGLGRLREWPVDALHLDASFVASLGDTANAESAAASLAHTLVHLGHSLRLSVLAEGVSRPGELSALASAGCDTVQGPLFHGPLPADEAAALLARRERLAPELTTSHPRQRTLLLVDDEPSMLSALRRLFRRDGYRVLTAGSGAEGLELMATTDVDVIVSDQRMPGMAGVDFLRKAKERWPETIRMTLSGFTDLQTIIDAVNEGAVFKFLVKPWDDERLRDHVAQAFRQKELADENRRLNQLLARAGVEQAQLARRLSGLLNASEAPVDELHPSCPMDALPVPVLGLDPHGLLAYLNADAQQRLPELAACLGGTLPPAWGALGLPAEQDDTVQMPLDGLGLRALQRPWRDRGRTRGTWVFLLPAGFEA